MKELEVKIEDAHQKVKSYQCSCGYFEFESETSQKAIVELKRKHMKRSVYKNT